MDIPSFVSVYEQSLQNGHRFDAAQQELAVLFNQLGRQLHLETSTQGWFKIIWNRIRGTHSSAQGLYIWGGVGRGKTYLMDLFFKWLPIEAKRRIHFHRFMSDLHHQLHNLKGVTHPLQLVAVRIADQTKVLCLDEFYVSDIGDAMILAEVLKGLFEQGVILVATSNIEPKDLYENGLQRSRFLPAIALIEKYTRVVNVKAGIDYRLEALQRDSLYRIVAKATEQNILENIQTLVESDYERDTVLEVLGRSIQCIFLSEGVAGFTFNALCATPRSTEDYIELSRLFHTIVLYDIPTLTSANDSAVRRFINLIDEFYDRNVNVLFYANVPVAEIYQGVQLTREFERTQSRILEMQSDEYLTRAHKT